MNGKWCWWPCLGCFGRATDLAAAKPGLPMVLLFLLPVIMVASLLRALADWRSGATRCGYVYELDPDRPKGGER